METIFPELSNIFSWLIDYTIDISVFIGIIFFIKTVISKRFPAWWHYGLWLVLLVRMIIPFKYESSSEVPGLAPLPVNIDILNSIILEKNQIISGIASSASSNIHGFNISFDNVMISIWLAGALFLCIFYIFKNIKFWLLIKEKPVLANNDILDLLEDCRKRMKIKSMVKITVTDEVKSPALFGYLRPRLLLPEGVPEKLSHSELAYLFMHELAHLKRHDIGISWIVTLLQAFQWFNPIVWLAFYQMRIDQESACDASVLKRLQQGQSKDYAAAILDFLEKFYQNRRVSAMAGIIENKSQIKRRIAMIIKYRQHSKKNKVTAVLMLMLTGLLFFTLTGFARDAKPDSPAISEEAGIVMAEAGKDIDKGDYHGALKKLNTYISANPDSETVPENIYEMIANCYMYLENYDEAVRVAEEAHNARPDSENLFILYAAAVLKSERYADAAFLFEKVYDTTDKKDIGFLEGAASSYYKDGNYEQARRVLKRMINNTEKPKKIWFDSLISICLEQGKEDEAEEYIILFEEHTGKAYSSQIPDKHSNIYDFSIVISNHDRASARHKNDTLYSDWNAYKINEVDQAPSVLRWIKPKYPVQAEQDGIKEGKVIVRFVVDMEGRIQAPQVVEANPEGYFEEAALDTLSKFKFRPAVKNGENVSCVMRFPVEFQ